MTSPLPLSPSASLRARSSIEHEAMRGRAWRKREATERSSTYRRWRRIVSSLGSGMLLLVRLSSALLAWLCAERGRNRERSREQQGKNQRGRKRPPCGRGARTRDSQGGAESGGD
jgi:hypothetical protein